MDTIAPTHTDPRSPETIAGPSRQSPPEATNAAANPAATADGAPNRWAEADEDVRLMLAFQSGDASAFARLVENNQARVFGVVHRFCTGRGDLEDLVQEVFLRVFRSAERYTPAAKFSTWLYRIAANVSLSALRSAGKLKTTQLRIAGADDDPNGKTVDVEDTSSAGPDEAMAAAELAEQVRGAIEQLPENQRTAIILSRYEELPYEQISEVMSCSTMAVKSLLSRARTNLRRLLAKHLQA